MLEPCRHLRPGQRARAGRRSEIVVDSRSRGETTVGEGAHPRLTWTLGHRPSLDSLRGLAVLMVVVGHVDLTAIGASMSTTGVGIFFALSGYLITGLLLEEFDPRVFYVRRARRLLPALAVFVAAMLLAGQATPLQAVPVALYFTNVAKDAGFALGPFAHLWSLSVEEQFYIVWPLLLVLVGRLGIRRPLVLALATLALMAAGWPWAATLLGGATVAIASKHGGRDIRPPRWLLVASVAYLAGMSVVGYSVLTESVFAVAATTLVAAVAASPRSWKPLEMTGRISYAMYLWHYPLAIAMWPTTIPWLARLALLMPWTFATAGASWVLVERRFLRGRDHRRVLGAAGVPTGASDEWKEEPTARDVIIRPSAS